MSHRFGHKFEHTLESQPADSAVTTVRRLELITGPRRRRQWSDDDKARIVIESLKPGANVSEVARRHGLSPQQLFGWRRQAREAVGNAPAGLAAPDPWRCPRPSSGSAKPRGSPGPEPAFAPVVIASATSSPAPAAPPSPPADTVMRGLIEIAISDAIVRVHGQTETGLLIAVLRAVRRRSERIDDDQLALALEALETEYAKTEAQAEKADPALKSERTKKRRASRNDKLDHLPHEEVVIEPESKVCPCCNEALHVIGEDVSRRLDKQPAKLTVIVTRRPKLACRRCEKTGADEVAGIIQARRHRCG